MNRIFIERFILSISVICCLHCLSIGQESIELYFTQPIYSQFQKPEFPQIHTGGDAVKQRTIDMINEAHFTLDVCMYNASDIDIIIALMKASDRGVRVRYITDDNTSNSAIKRSLPFPVLYSSKGDGIMHNKFMVADAYVSNLSIVMAGSMNWTASGEYADANNIFFIKQNELALAFTKEFDEMWGSSGDQPTSAALSGNQKKDNTPHEFVISGIPVELYFSPSDGNEQKIDDALRSAQYSVDFGMYTFTSDGLSDELLNLHSEGVDIHGIVDNFGSSDRVFYKLKNQGIDVIDHTPETLLHHKYCIIDAGEESSDPIVVTGSYNWTYSASTINDEYSLIIHDNEISLFFQAEFMSRYCDLVPTACDLAATNKWISNAVEAHSLITSGEAHLDIDDNLSAIFSVTVFSITGQPVLFKRFEQTGQKTIELDFTSLPPNTYLALINDGKQYKLYKIIKI